MIGSLPSSPTWIRAAENGFQELVSNATFNAGRAVGDFGVSKYQMSHFGEGISREAPPQLVPPSPASTFSCWEPLPQLSASRFVSWGQRGVTQGETLSFIPGVRMEGEAFHLPETFLFSS